VCRPAASACDAAERCDGTSNTCPSDGFQPVGAACADTDGLSCTTPGCDGAGQCEQSYAADCTVELCRTAGFWGTHTCPGGQLTCNSGKSNNITQTLINFAGGCIDVCGEVIRTTQFNDADSATEALCMSVRGNQRIQLMRQLTAAALNCIISGGRADCAGVSTEALFKACNDGCAAGDASSYGLCIAALDCLNSGGSYNPQTGVCQIFSGNCYAKPLRNSKLGLDFNPPGPAGGGALCQSATSSPCTPVGSGEAVCALGTKNTAGPEACP
jgi:hypothetical protein